MKIMKHLLLSALLLLSHLLIAHPGGHGSHAHTSPYDLANIRTWHFQDESIAAKGSFMFTKEDKVIIETEKSIKAIAIAKLSRVDQQFVKGKMARIAQINAHKVGASQKESSTILAWLPRGFLFNILYGVLFLFLGVVTYRGFKNSNQKFYKNPVALASMIGCMFFGVACTTDDVIDPTTSNSATSDPAVVAQAFVPYSNVSTTYDSDYLYVASNGLASHEMMAGIWTWIDQFPTEHDYSAAAAWPIPLKTEYATEVLTIEDHFHKGAIAIAANGIPIFNPYNASNLISNDIGELDAFGGHSGRGDDYHYHIAPMHLENTTTNLPIAYALDGYPVYGTEEPDGSPMTALDSHHGHEHTDGTYHYHGTADFPYMIASMKGKVATMGTAPEDQITPQPVGQAFRSDPIRPISGPNDSLLINSCVPNGSNNGYTLNYTLNNQAGSVEYSWNATNLYTFIFNDANGTTVTETHQK